MWRRYWPLGLAALWVLPTALRFLWVDAVFVGQPRPDCTAAAGACWPLITQSLGALLVGRPAPGGLLLSLLTAFGVYLCACPPAALLALGRHRGGPVGALCTAWIEFFRGLPAVAVLFAAVTAAPLLIPSALLPNVYGRAFIALICFQSAYLAEIVRGGFAAVSRGMSEAAAGLGLTPRQARRYVLWPLSLRAVAPGLMNSLLSLFKDTSLLMLVGINDFLGASEMLVRDPERTVPGGVATVYVFVGAVYALTCVAISRLEPSGKLRS